MSEELERGLWMTVRCATEEHVIKTADCSWCRVASLEADLTLLSDKACAAVVGYRAALNKLTDSFRYPTEVVTIASEALKQGDA